MQRKLIQNKTNIVLAVASGLLLTASFPKIEIHWLAWFCLVPLLFTLRRLLPAAAFRIGFIFGFFHFVTLLYWLVPVMRTYGYLPAYLAVLILLLFSAVLAVFTGVMAAAFVYTARGPVRCLVMFPLVWVTLEYIRSFLFSGFPWEYLGYSQFRSLPLIQIADISGVYGLSLVIALANAAVFLTLLHLSRFKWQESEVAGKLVIASLLLAAAGVGLTWSYGTWRAGRIDQQISRAPKARVSVVQGNIDQATKWDPAFQFSTIEKYFRLSRTGKAQTSDLIVWPESATPFFLLYDKKPSEMVFKGIEKAGTDFLIGSPSLMHRKDATLYFNSAYLIAPQKKEMQKYDKAHLVPYGEYVPFKKWLPFLGKIVAQVGDFRAGKKGHTLTWEKGALGIQICYEIIFPNLSRAMAKNGAVLLVNITNDAWFGTTSGPYQHFSMTIFRAVENRRSLARSANTGISGFVDPVGRILEATELNQDAVVTGDLPLLSRKSFYTRFGDLFALVCLGITLLLVMFESGRMILNRR